MENKIKEESINKLLLDLFNNSYNEYFAISNIKKLLDGRIASEEVGGARSKGNDFEIVEPIDCSCDGQEFVDHIRTIFRIPHGIFGNIRLDIAEL